MKDGLVSIITPSYNTGRFISATIESVLNQTYSNWEMIIVDDCSTDDTDEIIKNYTDYRIRYFKKSKNTGAADSRNIALKEAKGEWIAFLDSDDLWKPDKLRKQIEFMKRNHYKFSCTYNDYIDEDSNPLGRIDTCPRKINKAGMYMYNWVSCLTVMYNRKEIGLIQIRNIPKRNDYALWLKVIKKADCYCLPEVLGSYRVRKKSVSHDKLSKLIRAHYDLYRKAESMCSIGSILLAIVNVFFGVLRKLVYVNNEDIV